MRLLLLSLVVLCFSACSVVDSGPKSCSGKGYKSSKSCACEGCSKGQDCSCAKGHGKSCSLPDGASCGGSCCGGK